jgi:mRNA interferase MazF
MAETASDELPGLCPGLVVLRQPHRDSGDSKRRPCVVISNPGRCQDPAAATVIVVPLTSQTDGQPRLPMPVIAADGDNGLQRTSAAMCGRVSCVRKDRLVATLGVLKAADLRAIRLGVAAVVGLADVLIAAKAIHASAMEN